MSSWKGIIQKWASITFHRPDSSYDRCKINAVKVQLPLDNQFFTNETFNMENPYFPLMLAILLPLRLLVVPIRFQIHKRLESLESLFQTFSITWKSQA
ncbi:hypothetical protein DFP97_10650 [Paenibacillus prosopidis]|uniref:Uncharacterized protein n=1 Tax=Paenibacillus prosopidis TaxID=630520 RepID=A0A368W0J5_9BACL|nr:hypothetical protein DFP97_10650 [Paenibacillus prosopidis]